MDHTLDPVVTNEIVVEWEAGATANANAEVDINFQIAIWNHTDGKQAAPTILKGPENTDGTHQSCIYELTHNVGAASRVFVVDKMYEITACLYRAPNTVSFYKGPMFYVITPPPYRMRVEPSPSEAEVMPAGEANESGSADS
jgi:hypothetical protein